MDVGHNSVQSNFQVESSGSSGGYNLSHITKVNFTKIKNILILGVF